MLVVAIAAAVSMLSRADAACTNLPDAMPVAPKDIPSSDVLRRQIVASLKQQSYDVPEAAWSCSDWSAFAEAVNVQDFAFQYMACGNASSAPRRFVHIDYGAGDNDFGSVHEVSEEQSVCRIFDGEWEGDDICDTLDSAAADDATIKDRWAILDLPRVHVAEAKTIDGEEADNYGGDLHFFSFGTYVDFWDSDGSEFLRLTSASNKTCIVMVDGNAMLGRSPDVHIWKDGKQPQLKCRVEQTREWQQQTLMEKYPGAWCTRFRIVLDEEQEEPFHVVV